MPVPANASMRYGLKARKHQCGPGRSPRTDGADWYVGVDAGGAADDGSWLLLCRRSQIDRSVLASSEPSPLSLTGASSHTAIPRAISPPALVLAAAALSRRWAATSAKCLRVASMISSSGVVYAGSRVRLADLSLRCPAYRTSDAQWHSSPPSKESTNSSSTITSLTLSGTTG
eukprot:CAMPEP_0173401320 /NCGR_PEP_ID=MMETSP1356-20130122/50512_1 /TAXON_ID=77927 ORGANISM="Hemiselmis virescens, Strain PCC157" /NCGR_SAMPLE_ID=MMETSP1356 /ASSEMBLY_ACC=CAM_ASM_000847 /LENGTH=172 /DNA_ID=CAMNT_0014361431 /DNA_START=300 /DNA_END=819 /DNA_ORIENTATION=+